MKTVNKITNIALGVGFIGIILSVIWPVWGYIGTTSFCVCYFMSLVKEYITNKKVSIISVILCTAAILWLLLGKFFHFKYAPVLGIITIYGYIINSVYQITGKISKDIILLAILLLSGEIIKLSFLPNPFTKAFLIFIQIILLYRLLYPVVYKVFMLIIKTKNEERTTTIIKENNKDVAAVVGTDIHIQ